MQNQPLQDAKAAVTGTCVSEDSQHVHQGHTRSLTINFNLWSTLGLVYSLTATPFGVGTYLSFSFFLGGSPFYIYGYIFAVCLNIVLCISLAEMAALHPHPSGWWSILTLLGGQADTSIGQIYWASKFAPARWSRSLSYWTGVFTTAAWFFWTAGTFVLVAQLLLAVVTALSTTYVLKVWHTVLVSILTALVSLLLNVPAFRCLPVLAKVMVVVTNCGTILAAVALLAQAHPKRSAYEVFVQVNNVSGWSSTGVAFFLSLLPAVTAINGFDSAAHLAEEMDNPAKQVPQVMIGNAILSTTVGLPMAIIFCFCITKPEALLDPVGGQVVIQLFLDSLDSKPLFILIGVMWVWVTFVASVGVTTTTSRVWWTFARQGGLPLHSWVSKTTSFSRTTLPANSIYIITIVSCLVILLYLGPSLVLNAILGTASICFYISYAIPVFCMLRHKQHHRLPKHYFNLGHVTGNIILTVSGLWSVFISVWLVLPLKLPVTPSNMNYTSVVLGGLILLFSIYWCIAGKKQYQEPEPLIIELPSED